MWLIHRCVYVLAAARYSPALMANTPLLTTHWQHHDLPTQKLIHGLWQAIDSRKRGSGDYKSGHAVLAGIFALRHEETFAVNKRSLTRAEGRSWDLILERHMGSLLRRSSGKNRYSLSPEFTAATSVVESNDATLLMRVEGQGVRYTTPNNIVECQACVKKQHQTKKLLFDIYLQKTIAGRGAVHGCSSLFHLTSQP